MRKNNKGFTLIELISVLALVAIIAALSFQIVTNRITKSKQKLKITLEETLKSAANKYLLANPSLDKYHTSKLCIAVTTLQNNGYLEKGEIKDPVTNESMLTYYVSAQYDSDKKQYQFTVTDSHCSSETTPVISDYLVEQEGLVGTNGLYEDSDSYVYRGANAQNYVSFNSDIWRIVSIDKETKFVKIVRTRSESEGYRANGIIETLNASFDTDYSSVLVKQSISKNSRWYTGTIDDATARLSVIKSLERQRTDYYTVGLLSVSDYKNSFASSATYLSDLKDANNNLSKYFLSTKSSDNKVWAFNGSGLVKVPAAPDDSTITYKIYPVIYLNLNARIKGGTGSSTTPYQIN